MSLALAAKVIAFIAANKATIIALVVSVEALTPDASGSSKSAAVKAFIGNALGISDTIDAVWPTVSPIFNLLVAQIKATTTVAAST